MCVQEKCCNIHYVWVWIREEEGEKGRKGESGESDTSASLALEIKFL